ncbi:hypothetical protein [Pseudooceanicola aestuarii]|uniref:hypothetical protein n=1 Tax=Pseudooceanicola aestuarii TaxID=2697319 RepID=UPI0013D7B783|nr:hypothetical protein [Pseudooceanicola aestuarii]
MSADKLAYFFDHADLCALFRDWPQEIGLVLCMDDAGSCDLLLFHEDARQKVLEDAGAVLDRAPGEFAVVPRLDGYPTRRVLFSDEQKLMQLIGQEDDLAEMAADHLINHQFEIERRTAAAAEPGRSARPPAVPLAEARSAPAPWRPRFRLSYARPRPARPAKAALPPGFLPARQVQEESCSFPEGQISMGRRGVRVTLHPEKVSVNTAFQRVEDVAFRDDYASFMLPVAALKGWHMGDPLVLDIEAVLFPIGLRQRLALAPRRAEITVTPRGVFVAPAEALPQPEEEAAPPRRRAPFLRRSQVALVAILACLGLATGTSVQQLNLKEAIRSVQMVAAGDLPAAR